MTSSGSARVRAALIYALSALMTRPGTDSEPCARARMGGRLSAIALAVIPRNVRRDCVINAQPPLVFRTAFADRFRLQRPVSIIAAIAAISAERNFATFGRWR